MTLEPYQEKAAEWLSRRKMGMVVAPAGSGKTLIAAAALSMVIMRRPRERKVKVGWMANTIEQCQQAQAAVDNFPEMIAWLDLKIACAAAGTDWSDRDGLIVDECHHGPAPEWFAQIETCKGVRWGFTATPDSRDEVRDDALRRMFGEVFTVSREEVKNRVTGARVIMLDATDEGLQSAIDAEVRRELPRRTRAMRWVATAKHLPMPSDGQIYGQLAFQKCVEIGFVANARRNDEAVKIARQHGSDFTLLLVNQVEHGLHLASRIPGAMACYSKMGAKKRREALAAFKEGRMKCLVATSLADEGLDVPICNVVILVSGGRSNAKTEQRTGRALRVFAGKERAIIYDWKDEFHPLTAKHSRVRQELYRKLGYEIVDQKNGL